MQSSVNQLEMQKSELRAQISNINQSIFQDKDVMEFSKQRQMERSSKEHNLMQEIQQLKLKLQSYMDGYEDQRNHIKSEAKGVLNFLNIFESQKHSLD
jgi:hypothetical protein